MHDVVDDLVAALRRHETALSALRTPGHRPTSAEELARIERKLECCEQWLKLLRVDEDLVRRRAAAAARSQAQLAAAAAPRQAVLNTPEVVRRAQRAS